jgi:hypothetical protein
VKQQLSEIVASKICNELTSHLDYKLRKLQHQRERSARTKLRSVEFACSTIELLGELDNFRREEPRDNRGLGDEQVGSRKEHGLVKRGSINLRKVRRNTLL